MSPATTLPPGDKKAGRLAFLGWPLLLFACALAPRLIGITWGLPSAAHWYSYHPDERQIYLSVGQLDFLNGQFDPRFFNYPSLFIYATYLLHLCTHLTGLLYPPGNAFLAWQWIRDVLLCGRLVSAICGAATVPLVFLICREIRCAKLGLCAAALLAFLPGHVQHSHFATVDISATFLVTLSLWLTVRGLMRTDLTAHWQWRQFFWSAVVAGLATATKYNMGLALIAPLAGFIVSARWRGEWNPVAWMRALGLCIATGFAFLLGCPFVLLNFHEFWGDCSRDGFCYEALVHPKLGQADLFTDTGNGWLYHLSFNLPFVMTWPVLLVALCGLTLVFTLHQKSNGDPVPEIHEHRVRAQRVCLYILAGYTLIFFATLGTSQVRFMRYTLPLTPTLCLFAAYAMATLAHCANRRFWTATLAATAMLLAIDLVGASNVVTMFVAADPRDQAAAYMFLQPAPTTVGFVTDAWFEKPPITPNFRPPPPIQTSLDGRYGFIYTFSSVETLRRESPRWLISSDYDMREQKRLQSPQYKNFIAAVGQLYGPPRIFLNHAPLALPGRDYVPHDYLYTNPETRVYPLK